MLVHVQNVLRRTRVQSWIFFALAAGHLARPPIGEGQELPHTKNYIKIGHEFLRAVYPDLNGKGYAITIETSLAYDGPTSVPNYFMLDVGAGPKFVVIECCVQGYVGGVLPTPPLQWPPELGAAPTPTPPPPQPIEKRPKFWDAEGRVHPKQYLSTGFQFDNEGHLAGFTASGPEIGNPEADNKLAEIVNTHPKMTDAEIAAELKRLGAKYGPDDKEQFVKDLPLKKLEPFLGKLELISVSFLPLSENRTELGSWPYWMVELLATQRDGSKLKYHLAFDHFKGDLLTLATNPANPGKITKKHQ